MKKFSIFITGGHGHIGSSLVVSLIAMDYDVTVSHADVRDFMALSCEMRDSRPDLVIHCAAIVNTDVCNKVPHDAWAVNADGSGNVALAAALCGAALMHFSTTATYDPHGPQPYSAYAEQRPVTVYGKSKLRGEQLSLRTFREAGMEHKHVIIRPCFVYGGKNDASNISSLIRAHMNHKVHVTQLDRNCLKDWIHVSDFVYLITWLVHFFALENRWTPDFSTTPAAYNVAAGNPLPFSRALDLLKDKNLMPPFLCENPGDDYLGDHVCDGMPLVSLVQSISPHSFTPKDLYTGIDLVAKTLGAGS